MTTADGRDQAISTTAARIALLTRSFIHQAQA
jgi:hypothetical protein